MEHSHLPGPHIIWSPTWSTLVEEARKETLLAPSREGFGAGTSDGRWGEEFSFNGRDGETSERGKYLMGSGGDGGGGCGSYRSCSILCEYFMCVCLLAWVFVCF